MFAAGSTISDDQKTLAVRLFESNNHGSGIENSRRFTIAVFKNLDQATGEPQQATPHLVLQLEQKALAALASHSTQNRVLILSPDGRYLLAGTRTRSGIAGQLFELADGRTVSEWGEKRCLGQVVSALSHDRDHFATLDGKGKAIRLIEWASGREARRIVLDTPAKWLCVSSDAKQFVVASRNGEICRYDSVSGECIKVLKSELIPVSWCSTDDVFIGYQDDNRDQSTGSLVLADCNAGTVRAIIKKRIPLGAPAAFSVDGNALMYTDQDTAEEHGVVLRNLTPSLVDKMLNTEVLNKTLRRRPGTVVSDTASSAIVGTQQSTEGDYATNLSFFQKNINSNISVTGKVGRAVITGSGDGANIFLEPVNAGCLLWISPRFKPEFDAAFNGDVCKALVDKKVVVKGILGFYGGRSQSLIGRFQIALEDVSQLEIVE